MLKTSLRTILLMIAAFALGLVFSKEMDRFSIRWEIQRLEGEIAHLDSRYLELNKQAPSQKNFPTSFNANNSARVTFQYPVIFEPASAKSPSFIIVEPPKAGSRLVQAQKRNIELQRQRVQAELKHQRDQLQ